MATQAKLSKVLVGGGTGFVGRALCRSLEKQGYNVTVISRTAGKSRITWDNLRKIEELPECDAVINLAGESIMNPLKRWNAEYQSELRTSRIGTTRLLSDLITKAKKPPKVWISSSAEGYYPSSLTEEFTEDSAAPEQHNFITKLCYDWEDAAKLPSNHSCRSVVVRLTLVLGRDGGTIQGMIWPFWFGLGGRVGSGQQPFPWIHISDAVGIYVHALKNENVSGILNAGAPQLITNSEFTKAFSSALWRPAIFPLPEAVVNMVFGKERGSLLVDGKKVIPKRTLESGYSFLFPDIKSCLEDIVK